MAFAALRTPPRRDSRNPGIQRSFTAPVPATPFRASPQEIIEPQSAETVFVHPSGKIVAFEAPNRSRYQRHSSVTNGQAEFREDAEGTLPWATLTEKTLAIGPLKIYRLGQVSFLSSGKALQPIMSKSQCWCVDGVSKFVLRIRPNSYWRIELPHQASEEKELVERFKEVLDFTLQYEKTPCPFKRGFTVDLPEAPQIIKVPWRPRAPLESQTQEEQGTLEDFGDLNSDKLFAKENIPFEMPLPEESPDIPLNQHYKPEKVMDFPHASPERLPFEDGDSPPDEDSPGKRFKQKDDYERACDEADQLVTPPRPQRIVTGRTVTAPPQLYLRTSPPSANAVPHESHLSLAEVSNAARQASPLEPVAEVTAPASDERTSSITSSTASFHSFHSPISPLPPSPPSPEPFALDEEDTILQIPRVRGHKRYESEVTIKANNDDLWDLRGRESRSPSPAAPMTPTLTDDNASQADRVNEVPTASPPALRVRRTFRQRRAHSPLPPAANIHSPRSPSRLYKPLSGYHLTTAILQRAYSLLMSPPSELLALMMRIAAKIARGTLQGSAVGLGEGGERVPCTWDFSSEALASSPDTASEDDVWWEDEDDYGINLSKPASSTSLAKRPSVQGWEID